MTWLISVLLFTAEVKYEFVSESGEGHNRQYTMKVTIDGQDFEGTGRSKKGAKIEAAKYALIKIFNILTVPSELFPLSQRLFILARLSVVESVGHFANRYCCLFPTSYINISCR